MSLESPYKTQLVARIKEMFPGCLVLRNDANYMQGVPDVLILYKDRWAALEVKRSPTAEIQPNQPYYVDKMYRMSYASFVFPQNEEEVLHDLQRALRPRRSARLSQR